ncbi:transposase family protein [Hungatella hathewayi]|uniref:transposase family protein n=1 Tax=Hungatella hathewayi TaxID=154046 RepID=UPI00356B1A64
MKIQSVKENVSCPYCGCSSSRVHSTYLREIQDIPFQDKQTILLLSTRKMFCDNPKCIFKTFSEQSDFVKPKVKKPIVLLKKY